MHVMKFLIIVLFIFFPLSITVEAKDEQYIKVKSMKTIKMNGIDRQTRDYSCAAASLALLFKNYFNLPNLNESLLLKDMIFRLNDDAIEDRKVNGFSMLDMKNLVERLGLVGDGVVLQAEALNRLKGPVIILLEKKDIKHFVVLKGVDNDKAYIADPIQGHYSIPLYDLKSQWRGHTFIVGRPNYGLPSQHNLQFPKGSYSEIIKEPVRNLTPTKYNRKSLHSSFIK